MIENPKDIARRQAIGRFHAVMAGSRGVAQDYFRSLEKANEAERAEGKDFIVTSTFGVQPLRIEVTEEAVRQSLRNTAYAGFLIMYVRSSQYANGYPRELDNLIAKCHGVYS